MDTSRGPTLIWDAHSGFEAWPHTDLAKLAPWRDAGVDFVSVNVGYDVQSMPDMVRALANFRRFLRASDNYALVGTQAEFDEARRLGQTAVAFDLEGVNVLEQSLDMLRLSHELGVRQIALAYNRNSDAAGGCHDDDTGLTPFGRDAIALMNELGIVVDCSHCGFRSTLEAIEMSTAPVVFSHSNARALHDHERNISDEQAIACAAKGGVVGVNGINLFLGDDNVTTAAIADHAAHWIELVGSDHVGIGLDYFFEDDGSGAHFTDVLEANAHYWPEDQYPDGAIRCAHPRQLSALGTELRCRGFSADQVEDVMGRSFARLAAAVWG
ncbi:MAG: membrane dipeptidase [Pseudomonadota bacterium]